MTVSLGVTPDPEGANAAVTKPSCAGQAMIGTRLR
jgi:hypothetical protein